MKKKSRLNTFSSGSSSGTATESEFSDLSETESIEADDNPFIYFEAEAVKVMTEYPLSVTYKDLVLDTLPNIPRILMQLVDRIDQEVPPLKKLCYGISEDSVANSDRILSTLIATKKDPDLCEKIIGQCTPAEVAQLIQLLFLRLEDPPFSATHRFCEIISQKDFILHPRVIVRKDIANSYTKATKECLNKLNIYQQATLAYFIGRCQRWCQSEVAYTISRDRSINATATYTGAVQLLSNMFADCVVGLPRTYIASRIMKNGAQEMTEFKRVIFLLLTGVIRSSVWQMSSLATICVPEGEIKQPKSEESITSSSTTSSDSRGVHKVRSFNWI